jgi:hypothetical protein
LRVRDTSGPGGTISTAANSTDTTGAANVDPAAATTGEKDSGSGHLANSQDGRDGIRNQI